MTTRVYLEHFLSNCIDIEHTLTKYLRDYSTRQCHKSHKHMLGADSPMSQPARLVLCTGQHLTRLIAKLFKHFGNRVRAT